MATRSTGGGTGLLGGFIDRVRTGLLLTKASLGVIRADPELLVFPALGGLSALAFWTLLLVPMWVAGLVGSGLEYAVLFVLYFTTAFAASFFSAALVHAVAASFRGEDPDVRDSVAAAWGMKRELAVWALASATVSVLLRWLEEQDTPLAGLLKSLFALGWTVTTFFVIPVIVFEDVTVRSMFSRSAETFRGTWGETIGTGFGISLVKFAVAAVGLVVGIALFLVVAPFVPVAGLVLGVFVVGGALLAAHLLGEAVWVISKTALYLYATESFEPDAFEGFDFESLGGRSERPATPGAAPTTGTE